MARRTVPNAVDEIDAARAREYALLIGIAPARSQLPICLAGLPRCAAIASPLGARACRRSARRPPQRMSSGSSASSSTCSSASAAANCCLTVPIISPASSTSGRWRGCATDLARLGIERAEGEIEPEDHAAVLCEIMAGFAGGRFGRRRAPTATCSRNISRRGSAASSPIWSTREAADFYRRDRTVGRVFMEIESEAFTLAVVTCARQRTATMRQERKKRTGEWAQ